MLFIVDEHRRYIGHLPAHLSLAELLKDVASVVLFQLKEQEGYTLLLLGGDRLAK